MINNPYIGSSLDDLLEEDGVLEEVEAIAKERVLAWQSSQSKLFVLLYKLECWQLMASCCSRGSYWISQAQVAQAVDLSRRNLSDFLHSNAIKALLGEGYTGTIFALKSPQRLT